MCFTSGSRGGRNMPGRRVCTVGGCGTRTVCEDDFTVDTMIDPACNPAMVIADFMTAMDRQGEGLQDQ
jgi:hypothetical protein